MGDQASFATRIRERYPEGLTGIIALGSTRTAYVLEHNRHKADPGHIPDFGTYADYILYEGIIPIIKMYLDLGGQNLIIPLLSYQLFYERGTSYMTEASNLCLRFVSDQYVKFYQDHDIDPYFVGIDTLLNLPEHEIGHQLAVQLDAFNKQWPYQEGRHKLIWEIVAIPLFSFLKAPAVMGAEAHAAFEAQIAATSDLREMYRLLYHYYARAVYGTDLPIPHFYVGASRNNDLKLRALLPIALLCGGPFRLFYTPYPSMFLTRETLQAILEDLAFGKPLRSDDKDYSGHYTSELIEAEYQRVMGLKDDPSSTIGLLRRIPLKKDS
ncbi:MAG: hypothetical protein IT324_14050 [Anaerolineae bacterium]|nr:hypothetical protein [Anaerolineae bacterium]